MSNKARLTRTSHIRRLRPSPFLTRPVEIDDQALVAQASNLSINCALNPAFRDSGATPNSDASIGRYLFECESPLINRNLYRRVGRPTPSQMLNEEIFE